MSLIFEDRHIGPRKKDLEHMLKVIGLNSYDELIKQTFPDNIVFKEPLKLDDAISEHDFLRKLKKTAEKNHSLRSLIGLGYYGTDVPAVVSRNVFENPSWYTSYTPYQSEISQGRLEALINFQTMISSLTGFPMSNSSMLDDATAAGEAMRMMFELRSRKDKKAGKNIFFVDDEIFPHVFSVMETRAKGLDIKIIKGSYKDIIKNGFDSMCFGALVQYPAANGEIRDYSDFTALAHENGILVGAYCDILALAIYKEPAAWGADIAVGSAQRFGLPLGFGGPAAGWMTTTDKYKRNIPGRIIGESISRLGQPAYRLALQTREQHIKRDKATSNICTSTALMAVMSSMYAVYNGPKEIASRARKVAFYTNFLAALLTKKNIQLASTEVFDTIRLLNVDASAIRSKAEKAGFNFYYPDASTVQLSLDELTDCHEMEKLFKLFGVNPADNSAACLSKKGLNKASIAAENLLRTSPILTQEVFNKYHSETEMMRYIKKLERKDISLTHSMIPLGSCTMKLNAASEMMPMSWPELTDIHPFVPKDQAQGYFEIIHELEKDLSIITGFETTSLQPNSGAAGEFAGLATIKNYFRAKGETERKVILIPTSAHGTNPASAHMAGFEIDLVECDEHGNVMVDELRIKAKEHKDDLAGLMITYPSTNGILEDGIREICEIIHENGGQIYMDGANMNGQVGITSPGYIGADICHLNLHKTFAIAHGGGGPGIGSISAAKHLVPYLPSHPIESPEYMNAKGEMIPSGKDSGEGNTAVSAAPYGFPLLLPVTLGYIKMLGREGLRNVTLAAILNANYMAERLKPDFDILYTGTRGRVAHECIINLQSFKSLYGVDANDLSKRLMDYGFHAPTLSFPVHETFMVEPTESESKEEIDKFVDAMKSIKKECEDIKAAGLSGKAGDAGTVEDNVIKMAPHPAFEVCSDSWSHPYAREKAAYPLEYIRDNKFWPAVSRVDNGYGDRHLKAMVD